MKAEESSPIAYFVPETPDGYVEGQGFRVGIVTRGEGGYALAGDWPYEGKPGQKAPWFFPTKDEARKFCDEENTKLGLTPKEVMIRIGQSMFSGARRGRR